MDIVSKYLKTIEISGAIANVISMDFTYFSQCKVIKVREKRKTLCIE